MIKDNNSKKVVRPSLKTILIQLIVFCSFVFIIGFIIGYLVKKINLE